MLLVTTQVKPSGKATPTKKVKTTETTTKE